MSQVPSTVTYSFRWDVGGKSSPGWDINLHTLAPYHQQVLDPNLSVVIEMSELANKTLDVAGRSVELDEHGCRAEVGAWSPEVA